MRTITAPVVLILNAAFMLILSAAQHKDPRELDLADFIAYANARRGSGRTVAALPFAYEILHAVGGLEGLPATLRQARSRGQLPVAELVDRYPVTCRPVRDVLVHT